MTHEDSGHFAAKHPKGAAAAIAVAQAVQQASNEQGITCHAAHKIAAELQIPAQDVGIAIDLQESRIRKCQLGLFGYGPQRKAVRPVTTVAPELQAAIENALVQGRLACAEAWRIADAIGIPRLEVANSCERLKIKINQCQLGAF
jgi:hypothetical protein